MVLSSQRPAAMYCSRKCKQKSNKRRRRMRAFVARRSDKPCGICGGIFNGIRAARYCSQGCKDVVERRRRDRIKARYKQRVAARKRAEAAAKPCESCGLPCGRLRAGARWCLSCKPKEVKFSKYGMSAADYDRMNDAQGGRCAICGDKPERRLVVDHCHATGAVRGLLCGGCNSALGMVKDRSFALAAAARYLETAQQKFPPLEISASNCQGR